MKNIALLLILIGFLFSCKSTQKIQAYYSEDTPPTPVDTIFHREIDSVYLITQKGDTLSSLDEEVTIEIYRYFPDTITFAAVGDIMAGTNFPNDGYLPKDTGRYLWKEVSPILKNADITFGNLEGTILNSGGEQKECSDPDLCYLFRSPEYLAVNFKESGFDLMSVANNHANDFGDTGRRNTQRILESLQITHAGSIDKPYSITKIGHLKIGFCAFAPNRGAISIHNTESIKEIITLLDSLTDIVVASFHAGAEGSQHQHVTRKREFYHGEDRGNVYELAHLMVDHGADLVFGHGPHVVRAMEVYNGRIIAYSLGNFLTYKGINIKGLAGEAPILEVKTNANGEFLKGKIHSFRQGYDAGPRNDPNLSSVKTIQQLSLKDFPENPIVIDGNGNIFYKEKNKPDH